MRADSTANADRSRITFIPTTHIASISRGCAMVFLTVQMAQMKSIASVLIINFNAVSALLVWAVVNLWCIQFSHAFRRRKYLMARMTVTGEGTKKSQKEKMCKYELV